MMRRAWMVRVASVLFFGAAFGFSAAAVAAPLPPDVGWWWVGRAGGPVPLKLDPVPEVPEGGLYVARDSVGPSAVSAVRIRLERDVTDPVLTLDVSDTIGTPALDACVATAAWTPEQGGVWDQRPPSDCTRKVPGRVSADGSKVSFALASLVRDAMVDVVLVPAAPAEGAPTPAFSTAFEPLKAESVSSSPVTSEEPLADDSLMAVGDFGDTPDYSSGGDYSSGEDYSSGGDFGAAPIPDVEPLADAVATRPATAVARGSRTPLEVVALTSSEGFQYAGVLTLPLLLLVACGYVGWALTRPIDVTAGASDATS